MDSFLPLRRLPARGCTAKYPTQKDSREGSLFF